MKFEERPRLVDAIQWTGRSEKSIANMLRLFLTEVWPNGELSIICRKEHLVAKKLDWIVKDGEDIKIMTDKLFKKVYKRQGQKNG